MKRGTALTCALMIVMMNTPAASAERNIVSTIRGADYAISVDADVYGEGTSGLQGLSGADARLGADRRRISTFRCGLMQTCRQKKRTSTAPFFIRKATKRGSENATKRGSAHTAYPLCARRMRG